MENNKENISKVKLALLTMQRNSWEQGVAMQAFLEQGDFDIVIGMAKEAAYRRLPDGRAAALYGENGATDPCSVGEALGVAADMTNDKELKDGYIALLNWALKSAPTDENGIVYHFADSKLIWIDSMYMLPPFLASAGYYAEALKQTDGYCNYLFNTENNMFSHQWDDSKKEFSRIDAWGVGNGWAMAGIARVIMALPDEFETDKRRLISFVTKLIDTVLSYMTPDGLFHDIIDNPDTFVEVNLSQMLAYTLFRGMKAGWLAESYLEQAELLREVSNRAIDAYGLVQNVCGAPYFDKPGVAPEGQAFYLLMEAAANDYYQN